MFRLLFQFLPFFRRQKMILTSVPSMPENFRILKPSIVSKTNRHRLLTRWTDRLPSLHYSRPILSIHEMIPIDETPFGILRNIRSTGIAHHPRSNLKIIDRTLEDNVIERFRPVFLMNTDNHSRFTLKTIAPGWPLSMETRSKSKITTVYVHNVP